MENKARKKRKNETTLTDINKKNRCITIYDEIYKKIGEIKYDIYQIKENINEIIKTQVSSILNSRNENSRNENILNSRNESKIIYLERIIKENETNRDKEISEIKNEIHEIKEMILNINFQKLNISEDKYNMSYIN